MPWTNTTSLQRSVFLSYHPPCHVHRRRRDATFDKVGERPGLVVRPCQVFTPPLGTGHQALVDHRLGNAVDRHLTAGLDQAVEDPRRTIGATRRVEETLDRRTGLARSSVFRPSDSPRSTLSLATQQPKVAGLMSMPRATAAIYLPVSRTIRTAPSWKFSSYFLRTSGMVTSHSPCLHASGGFLKDLLAEPEAFLAVNAGRTIFAYIDQKVFDQNEKSG